MNLRRLLAPALSIALASTASASALAQDEIELEPVGSTLMQLESVKPVGWEEVGPGSYTRAESSTDLARLAMQAAPLPVEQLWSALLPQLGLSERPELAESRSTDFFDWSIYDVDIAAPPISVTLALADGDGRSYIVLLQSAPEEHATLREQVFDPALAALILRCLEKNPRDRPPDGAALAEELEALDLSGWTTEDARGWWQKASKERARPGDVPPRKRTQLAIDVGGRT